MSSRHKDEYPPLLNQGLHDMSVDELKPVVVDNFPHSKRREALWSSFLKVVERLKALKVPCKIWVDGSFLTQKIDPSDVDFVVDVPVHILDAATPAQMEYLDRLSKREFRKSDNLHSFIMFDAPPSDKRHAKATVTHEQWKKDFGLSYVTKEPKGIAVLAVRP